MHISRHGTAARRIQLKIMGRNKFLIGTIVVFHMLVLGSQLAAAQAVTRYDVFGGYSYLRLDSKSYGYSSYSNLNGANLAGAFNLTRNFSGVVDLGSTFAQNQHVYTFMAGPQASLQRYKGRLFAHALFGKARNGNEIPGVGSSLGRSLAFGGGYDFPFRHRFSIRLFQAEYLSTNTYGTTQNNVRVSAGVVFHFGKTLK
jgi:hypothetical protein